MADGSCHEDYLQACVGNNEKAKEIANSFSDFYLIYNTMQRYKCSDNRDSIELSIAVFSIGRLGRLSRNWYLGRYICRIK